MDVGDFLPRQGTTKRPKDELECDPLKADVRRCKTCLHYLLENAESTPEDSRNLYIEHFRREPWIPLVLEYAESNTSVRQLLNHKNLKKEITEMYGALIRMEKSAHALVQMSHKEDNYLAFAALRELKSRFL